MCKKRTRYSCGHSRLQSSKCRKIVARRRSAFGCFLDVFAPIRDPCDQILQEYNFRDLLCRACYEAAPERACQTYAPLDTEHLDQYQPEIWSNIDLVKERQQPIATEDSRHMSHAERQQLRQTLEEVGDSYMPSVPENPLRRHVRKDTVRFHGQSAARNLRRRDEIPLTPLRDAFLSQETSHSCSKRSQGESSRSQDRSQEPSHSSSHRTSVVAPSLQRRMSNVEPRTKDFTFTDEPYMETHIPQAVEEPFVTNPARGKTTRQKTSKRTCPASRSEAFADQISTRGFAEHRGPDENLIPAPLNLTKNRVLVPPPPRPSRPAETSPPAGPKNRAEPSPLRAPLSASRFVEHLDSDLVSPLSPDDIMNPQLSGRHVAAHQTAARSAGVCTFGNQQHLSDAQPRRPTTATSRGSAPTLRRRSFQDSVPSAFRRQLRGKESDDSFACETARKIEGSHKKKKNKNKKHHRRASSFADSITGL